MSDADASSPTCGQFRLAGRVAVVTGAAQGIGKSIALRFARDQAAVVVADVNAEKLAAAAEDVRAAASAPVRSRPWSMPETEPFSST